ncbi:MAG: TatD family hydrolase [Campylobacterales bacterium]
MLIDTHCHLDDARYFDDLDEVIARSVECGVDRFIIPGAGPADLLRAVQISEKYENAYFAVGVHPYHAAEFDEKAFELVSHPKCVAVGECGLDYYRLLEDENEKISEKKLQADVFAAQIEIAKKAKKPLIVHIRDASTDSKKMLLELRAAEVGGVLHCYNADHNLLSLADEGFYFGVGGVLTFSNAKKLVEVLPKIPLDRLLFETDAPYLTPMPHRGKRNEPSYMPLVVKKTSELLGISQEKLAEISNENSKKLFGV